MGSTLMREPETEHMHARHSQVHGWYTNAA